ncbi:MAG: dTMP kinase [candidate division KSB1 bacterium]|nr:dTMP kinase [candidate division KSB1 bacterium]
MRKPLFVTFEGIDGCGKSTQIALLHRLLVERGIDAVALRDPGSTSVSEAVRAVLLGKRFAIAPQTELLLYEAARAQLVQELIRPALEQGRVVLCDRFYDSTTAYQGYGRGIDPEIVAAANRLGSCGLKPHLTLLIDIQPEAAAERRLKERPDDRMEAEGLEFQRRVRSGFLEIHAAEPDRVRLIDGNRSIQDIQAEIQSLFFHLWEKAPGE